MKEFPPHLRHHWFPVALSSRVREKPYRSMVLGEPFVIIRDDAGKVMMFEDRCPHRGAPLSAGKLLGGVLRCPYHGWGFDLAGRCVVMPGSRDDKPLGDVRIPTLTVQERDGVIWAAQDPRQGLPLRLLAMQPERQRFLWETTWQTPILEAQENFLDALHTHTVHPGLVRRAHLRRELTATLRPSDDGFHVDYTGQPEQSGVFFSLFESRRTRERAHFSGLSVGQLEYRYAAGWSAFITLCFCPETLVATRIYAMLHVEGRWAPRWLVRMLVWPFLSSVANQDQLILESQAQNLQAFPEHRHIVTPLDLVRPHLERAWRGGKLDSEQSAPTALFV
jgi:phenylpropionate dioxygenase-like ring-hydroxylating dioxygenase large terminal subunit